MELQSALPIMSSLPSERSTGPLQAAAIADITKHYYEIRDFSFQDGTTLASVRLAYLDLNPNETKTALIITCFRGRLQSTLTFASGALQNHRIIVVALFGNGESSSSSNTPGFPSSIDYRDCVRAQRELLTAYFKLESVDIIMGFSMGGQCTYYWTLMYPDYVQNAIIICSSARTSLHNYQFLEGPKAALQNSADYVNKDLAGTSSKPTRGLHAFGKAYSAWLTSAEWFEKQMFKALGYETLRDWDANVTEVGYSGWDPDDLLAKLHMWQKGDVTVVDASSGGSLEQTLSLIKARVLLMPCKTDQYFRWEVSERESRSIPSAIVKVIPSIWGHIAGAGANPVDTNWMDQTITEFLAKAP
ncbi:Alpha/Beta hydrolase protein [Talaromyces proteolyticus]|uniref:Alpha/Beta hydrolase protein n=1 Tax=Talaromyces proteolyticus TaxID=1131652 RepID=A0AAD4KG27_9EURO|nr:Alpha/Beta hydrolase protein [Talaromyces proteolyticus]KAH8691498.1 Alpha/Beta hydrolase protein [Talaromyces proteolyticus]